MAVIASELKLYQALNMPTGEASTAGGGISAVEITGGVGGEVFPTTPANAAGGADKTHYQKVFFKNTNAVDDLSNSKVFITNALADVSGNGVVSLTSTSASDDTSVFARCIGFDAAGTAQTEDITLNGVAEVNGALTFSDLQRVEIRAVSGEALVNAVGDITVEVNSVAYGIVPTGYHTATAEIKIGLAAALDDVVTIANTLAAPGGIAFTKPSTYAAGVAVANAGVLTHAKSQGIWQEQKLKDGIQPSAEVRAVLEIQGDS